MMSREELIQTITEHGFLNMRNLSAKKFHDLKLSVLFHTKFLDEILSTTGGCHEAIRLRALFDGHTGIPKCQAKGCNTEVGIVVDRFHPHYKRNFAKFCCKRCATTDDTVIEKRRKTSMRNHGGVGSASQSIREKMSKTVLERFGVDHFSKTEIFQQKIKETSLERFGVDHFLKNQSVKEKTKATNMAKYGTEFHSRKHISSEVFDLLDDPSEFSDLYEVHKSLTGIADILGVSKKTVSNYAAKHGIVLLPTQQKHWPSETRIVVTDKEQLESLYEELGTVAAVATRLECSSSALIKRFHGLGIDISNSIKTSAKEIELRNFIKSLIPEEEIVCNKRFGNVFNRNLEIDIFVPKLNVGFEFNGVYWHSELYKDRLYHQKKALDCHKATMRLIQIWEDDWNNPRKRAVLESKIKHIIGCTVDKVFARKTKIRIPALKEVRRFMDDNHIQGFVGYSEAIGLYDGDEMVACMTLKKTKDDGIYDLNRYATSKSVVGGFGRLLKHFRKHYEWNELFTYASLDYSNGNLYEVSGFSKEHVTPPGLWFLQPSDGVRLHREHFMKHKLKDRLDNFDPDLSARQNMENHGYIRVFDSGSIKYTLKK